MLKQGPLLMLLSALSQKLMRNLVIKFSDKKNMSESDSERVSSVTSPPESYDSVPFSKDYQLKFFGIGCSRSGTNMLLKPSPRR